jgi:iron complex outermembrane receptor protein
MRNPNPSEFLVTVCIILLGLSSCFRQSSSQTIHNGAEKWTNFSVEVNPFINSGNFMFLRPVGFETTIRGAFPVWEYQQTNARLAGVDVQTHWKMSEQWQHDFA